VLDPVSAIALASSAYNAIKKGIEFGKELQDMGGQLSQWASAISDLEYFEKKAEDPPWYKAFSGSAQAEAMEVFAARKKIEAQRNELRTYIQFSYGQSGWEEFLRMEGDIRKRRQSHEHRKAEMKEMIISSVLIFLIVSSISGMLGLIVWLYFQQKGGL
jgi:nitrate reductase NapE component